MSEHSGNLHCTVLTHQQIPLLLAKSALSCWMYPTAQIALSPTPSHPWVPPEWPYCQQAQCRRWFTVKHSKAGLQTSSHPQNSASHLLGLQGPQQTPALSWKYSLFTCGLKKSYRWLMNMGLLPSRHRFPKHVKISVVVWNSLIRWKRFLC